ncbi:hypothetical protein CYLTODRAFT_447627 [Cylindrobasidium torrendii FP15055 ss-10]|uniref:Uncharacterized protein n=1 Tax=Cylindrobasidium torrendii FP15055 ss-10 TaxID=1314674 RepID=A0A0D7AUU5_9AGAR|nr:hypothetical protein CYLTODRAFT_447627 [Cylindrobasidium torrendii FP15055 ss-10]
MELASKGYKGWSTSRCANCSTSSLTSMQSPTPEFDPNIDPQLYGDNLSGAEAPSNSDFQVSATAEPPGLNQAATSGPTEEAEHNEDEMNEILLILGSTRANVAQVLSHTYHLGKDSRDMLFNYATMEVKEPSIAPLLAFTIALANGEALKEVHAQQNTILQALNAIRTNQQAAIRLEKADKDQIRAVCKATVGDHGRVAFDQEALGHACSQIFKAQFDTNGLARFFGNNISIVTRREFAKQVNICHSEAKSTVRGLLQEAQAKQLNVSATTCKIVKALLGSEMHIRTGHYLNVIVFFDVISKNPTLLSKGLRVVGRPPAKRARNDLETAPAGEQPDPVREDELTERFFGAVDKFFAEKIARGWGKDKRSYEWREYFLERFDHELKRDPRDEGLRKIKNTMQGMHAPPTAMPSNIVPPAMLSPAPVNSTSSTSSTLSGDQSASARPNGSMSLRNLLFN